MGREFYHYFRLSCNSSAKQLYRVRPIATALGHGRARVDYSLYDHYLARITAAADNYPTATRRRCILCADDIDQNRRTTLASMIDIRDLDCAPSRRSKDAFAWYGLWTTALRCLPWEPCHLLFGRGF